MKVEGGSFSIFHFPFSIFHSSLEIVVIGFQPNQFGSGIHSKWWIQFEVQL